MYLSDHGKRVIPAEEKVAELLQQRDKLDAQLAAEREKVRVLRRVVGIIERKADEPANPLYPLDEVGDIATAALAATEDTKP